MIRHTINHAAFGKDGMQYFDLKWDEVIDKQSVQPNAIDVRANSLSRFKKWKWGVVSETIKTQHIDTIPESPVKELFGSNELFGWWLAPGECYSFSSKVWIEVPDNMVGWLISRSSLNRNGVFIQSGLYDSGFKGYIAGTMYAFNEMFIESDTRVAQFIMADAEMLHKYDGQYQAGKQ